MSVWRFIAAYEVVVLLITVLALTSNRYHITAWFEVGLFRIRTHTAFYKLFKYFARTTKWDSLLSSDVMTFPEWVNLMCSPEIANLSSRACGMAQDLQMATLILTGSLFCAFLFSCILIFVNSMPTSIRLLIGREFCVRLSLVIQLCSLMISAAGISAYCVIGGLSLSTAFFNWTLLQPKLGSGGLYNISMGVFFCFVSCLVQLGSLIFSLVLFKASIFQEEDQKSSFSSSDEESLQDLLSPFT